MTSYRTDMQINEFVEGVLAAAGVGTGGWLVWKKIWNHTAKTGAETDIIDTQNDAISSLTKRVDELFKINIELQDSYLNQEKECRARDNALQDEIRALRIKVEAFEKREQASKIEQSMRKTGRLKTRKTDK